MARSHLTMGFDSQAFHHHLSTQTWGRPLHHYEVLDSTNTKLWELIKQGAKPGTAVIADQQQAGRGQWGRTWESAEGGLYLSVAIAPRIPVQQTAQITVATIWGLATLLLQHHVPVWLKWPNDILVWGQKLGGILTETNIQGDHLQTAVIGIGINWINAVPPQAITLQTILQNQPHSPITSIEKVAPRPPPPPPPHLAGIRTRIFILAIPWHPLATAKVFKTRQDLSSIRSSAPSRFS